MCVTDQACYDWCALTYKHGAKQVSCCVQVKKHRSNDVLIAQVVKVRQMCAATVRWHEMHS